MHDNPQTQGSPWVYKIQRYSLHDGPGIRTTLFFQGCPLSCTWCHNPESQSLAGPIPEEQIQPVTRDIMAEIQKDRIFYDESQGGVTFSGGEPLCQPVLLLSLLDTCRNMGIHTCLDTCGYGDEKALKRSAESADMILFDIKLVDPADHQRFTGRPPGRILENLSALSESDVRVKLRFPVIPGITDTPVNIESILDLLTRQTPFRDIHLLPYHQTGKGKYRSLGNDYQLNNVHPPGSRHLNRLQRQFESSGFSVTIGG